MIFKAPDLGKEKDSIKDIITEKDWKKINKSMEDNNIKP